MADLEAVLADVSYLMAMEKSRSQPVSLKFCLRINCKMIKFNL